MKDMQFFRYVSGVALKDHWTNEDIRQNKDSVNSWKGEGAEAAKVWSC